MSLQVKICCISSVKEATMAIEAGATAVGLVGPMPSGPGIISNELIAEIVQTIPEHIESFLLTSETSASGILEHHRQVNTSVIQLVDTPEEGAYSILKEALPQVKLVQVIHVRDDAVIAEAAHVAKFVDRILLDSGNPNLAVKVLGGTGRIHNWDISRVVVQTVNVPVFLAGGLKAENVKQAVQRVRPAGVDLCSGVRSEGQLDVRKLRIFFDALPQTL